MVTETRREFAMKMFVAGASGVLGRLLVSQLVDAPAMRSSR
jgi:hypothetical protein